MPLRLPLTVALLGPVGCGSGSDGPTVAPFALRDSAGILVAESADSAWTSDAALRIEEAPSLRIGSLDGDPPGTDFGRIQDAARLPDGRIAIADALSREVRLFDPEGALLATMGGRGSGPSEIQVLDRIGLLAADSIVVRDVGGYKHVIFAPDGTYGRTVTGPPRDWNGLSAVFVAGWLPDASHIVSHVPQPRDFPPGRAVMGSEIHRFGPEGDHLGMIDRLPALATSTDGGVATALQLGPRLTFRASEAGFWYGFPLTYELRHYTPSGLDRIVRRAWAPEAVTQEVRDRHLANLMTYIPPDTPPQMQQEMRSRMQAYAFPESLPAFTDFQLSPDGHLWVADHPPGDELSRAPADPEEPRAIPWSILDAEGRWLGTVVTPAGLEVLRVGEDYVMGVERDELDVEFLVIYDVRRGP